MTAHKALADEASSSAPKAVRNPFLACTQWLPLVSRDTMRADLMAGLTGALVVVPQGVAFATLAGMPPEYGLYAAMVPTIIAALFGSSWQLVSGPTTAASLMVFASMSEFAVPGSPEFVSLVLTLTLMVGAIELAMGLMRMGALVNYISQTVAIAFISGAAILIAVNQFDSLIGIDVPRARHFYDTLASVWHELPNFSPAATTVGVSAIVLGVLGKRLFPKFPNMIVSLLGSSLIAVVMNEVFDAGIETMEPIPQGLPPFIVPHLSLTAVRKLAATALAVTIFALPATMSTARSLAVKTGQQVDGNQEFIGQRLSNIIGVFFGGFVSTGSFNRSGLNFDAGAKTPIAAIASGIFLVGIVIIVAPYVVYLPKAGMAGLLMLVAWNLIDVTHIVQAVRSSSSEATVLAVTFFAVLFLDLELAVFAGVLLSLVFFLNRTAHPRVTALAPANVQGRRRFVTTPNLPECPQIKVVRIEGTLYFGAVASIIHDLHRIRRRSPHQKHLMLLAADVPYLDITAADALAKEATQLRQMGGALYIVGMSEAVTEQFRKTGFLDAIGEDNLFHSKTTAFAAIYGRLNRQRCHRCTARVFWECRADDAIATAELLRTTAEPAPGTETAAAPPATLPARRLGPRRRAAKRILVLVDDKANPRATVEMAARLARDDGAELALGAIVGWDVSHHSDLALGLISETLVASLRRPARARLEGLAADAGFPESRTLISTKQDPWAATLDMVTEWHPDLLVVANHGLFDPGPHRRVTYRTPSGETEVEVRHHRPGRRRRPDRSG
jgi:SulP family sulfate permease